jgi:TrpR family transcriptional regulator, trp operon repressor
MSSLDDLIDVLLSLKNKEEAVDLLEGILTPKELEEIPVRLQIVRMLKQGIPQHQIAEKLGIGVATVTRGSRELKRKRFKYI